MTSNNKQQGENMKLTIGKIMLLIGLAILFVGTLIYSVNSVAYGLSSGDLKGSLIKLVPPVILWVVLVAGIRIYDILHNHKLADKPNKE